MTAKELRRLIEAAPDDALILLEDAGGDVVDVGNALPLFAVDDGTDVYFTAENQRKAERWAKGNHGESPRPALLLVTHDDLRAGPEDDA